MCCCELYLSIVCSCRRVSIVCLFAAVDVYLSIVCLFAAVDVYLELVRTAESKYPEVLKRVFVINSEYFPTKKLSLSMVKHCFQCSSRWSDGVVNNLRVTFCV